MNNQELPALCRFGTRNYSVSNSNRGWLTHLDQQRKGRGFHWKDDIYFRRLDSGEVLVSHIADWNYTPRFVEWVIPAEGWQTITSQVSQKATAALTAQSAEAAQLTAEVEGGLRHPRKEQTNG